MLSEDTGTQGRGNYELELGYDWSRQDGDRVLLFQPQLSYGVSASVDVIAQPSWTWARSAGGAHSQGAGDSNLDAKWRFYGSAPWSLGFRAGVGIPTARDDSGLPHDRLSPHAILVLTADSAPFTFNANLGVTHAPGISGRRSDLYHFSAAATLARSERLFFVLDAAVDSNPDLDGVKSQAVALAGVIYTLRPGLDIDAGFRGRVNASGPVQQWLLGITFRGAL